MSEEIVRSRTFSWGDPAEAAQAARSLSGLEFFKAVGEGKLPLPPIMELMNIKPVEFSEGHVVFSVEPAEYHYNPIGVVHGGLAATLLDSSMSCAVHTMLPLGSGYTTLEIKINFVRALTSKTGIVYAEGKALHVGGRIATAEGRITDAEGKLYAHGTTTCLIMRSSEAKK